jgi:hypothetical protein
MTGRVKAVSFSMVQEGDKEVVKAKIAFESTASEGWQTILRPCSRRNAS